ncbi:MAG: hypothetical protein R2795_01315 [Saprospiraceae bacterium]
MSSTISLTKEGPSLSPIVAGVMTWGVWGTALSTTDMSSLIDHCLSLGITTFDHADIYGHYTLRQILARHWHCHPIGGSKCKS